MQRTNTSIRAIADGCAANRAVTALLAKSLDLPKVGARILSVATSRLKQVAVGGDPRALGDSLRELTAASPEPSNVKGNKK